MVTVSKLVCLTLAVQSMGGVFVPKPTRLETGVAVVVALSDFSRSEIAFGTGRRSSMDCIAKPFPVAGVRDQRSLVKYQLCDVVTI